MADRRPILHLAAVAGSCRNMMDRLGCTSAGELIGLVRGAVGRGWRVSGDARLIEAPEDDERGGRSDDARRASDFQRALADERVAAIVALRGGAWLTRILPRIDFDVLGARTNRVAIFGFSELTTVVNIASKYAKAVCWYDMGPAFIPTGLSRYTRDQAGQVEQPGGMLSRDEVAGEHVSPQSKHMPTSRYRGMKACHPPDPCEARVGDGSNSDAGGGQQFRDHLVEFFIDATAMVEGRASSRPLRGRLVAGRLPRTTPATIIGGTLSVLVSLLGTPYARGVFRPGHWLALEDVNEAPHRLDRMLAHLKLAGVLERCNGLLLGDFHDGDHDRVEQVLASLSYIQPKRSAVPIVVTKDFGHTWPMAPVPIGRKVKLRRTGEEIELVVPWAKLATTSLGN